MSEAVRPKKIFIVGMPRSGTTWIMWLLARHPGVVALQQSGLFLPLRRMEEWWLKDHRFTGPAQGEEEGQGSKYSMLGSTSVLEPDEIISHCREIGERVIERVAAASPGTVAVVEQTPEHIEFVSFIRSMFPDAYFLHVVRDPRAVYSSMRTALHTWASPGGFPSGPVHIARAWETYVKLGRGIEDESGHHASVRYEDLMADPDAELKRLGEWLGLDVSAEDRSTAIEACSIDKLRKNTKAPSGFFRRGSADGWKEELSGSELRTVEYVAREEMERWGYKRLHPRSNKKPLRVSLHGAATRLVRSRYGYKLLGRPTRAVERLGRTIQLMQDFKLLRY